jgi:energy-coupling factor transporter transmembrane protein EcfT
MDCFICCLLSFLHFSVTLSYSLLLFFFCVLYCSLYLYCNVSACDVSAATITGFFYRDFASVVRQISGYNSQRRGTTRTSQISFKFFYCYVCSYFLLLCTRMFRSVYSVYCLCVNVYCTTATGCQPNCSYISYISYHHIISYISYHIYI